MHLTETILISLASCLLVVLLPVDAYHLDSKPSHEKQTRHVRAIEAASTQPQQQQSDQQDQGSSYSRSGEVDVVEEPWKASGRFGGKWLSGSLYPRISKADSNFIRFGRSFHGFGGNSKKNNFIRLGRENPRQTNFIRLGRSGPWDSFDRFQSRFAFFPDYLGSHWSRPKDFSLNQDGAAYDYN